MPCAPTVVNAGSHYVKKLTVEGHCLEDSASDSAANPEGRVK